ncbi:ATP-binding cassette domain-containing protein [Roseateles sp. BYS180W]|uniref:ATP-binding cassette domain-containing protein n=1 Tax=Roseateles rivi TaxID=3299028 RepID=A0ABW7FWS4_9BURK
MNKLAIRLFLRRNAKHLAELGFASLLINLIMLGMPLFSMLVYDKAIGNQVHDTLWALAIGMALITAIEGLLRWSRALMLEHAGARWDAFLDERLMRGVLQAPLTRQLVPAEVMARMREVSQSRDALSAQSLMGWADLPFVLLFALAMAIIAGPLVFIPLALGLGLMALGQLFHALAHRRQTDANTVTRHKLQLLMDVLLARDALHGRLRAVQALKSYREQALHSAKASARARWWQQLQSQTMPLVVTMNSVLVLVVGVYMIEAQTLSVGGLISANLLAMRLLSAMCTVAPLWNRWSELQQALTELGKTVELKVPPLLPQEAMATALASEGLCLEGLQFTYPGKDRPALNQLNVQLRANGLVAVVGGSGSGKSSLLKVLAGQLPHTAGRYSFGAHLIDSDEQRLWLCRQVMHKPQDPSFLGGTVRDIVAGGDLQATDEAITTALRQAGLGPMLERGELGLNSLIGTNGLGLSGGQRQMLALASCFHGASAVLLLDEPTLGLDRQAQDRLIQTLQTLSKERCVLISTHAAELINMADRVLVLDRGQLVADGHPSQLMPTRPAGAAQTTGRMVVTTAQAEDSGTL